MKKNEENNKFQIFIYIYIFYTGMTNRNITALMMAMCTATGMAQTTIDISGNNTDKNYVAYSTQVSLPSGKWADVYMARYCYFSSRASGTGTLNLYAGGERCYLGTAKGAAWPDWTYFKGDVHIYPYKEKTPNAGFYGVVLAHGGKAFSPENVEDAIKSGKVNPSMENNKVTLHEGATLCCEANTSGAGFRIGELHTEKGSCIQGYMKKGTRPAYFIVGALNTDATLDGTVAPPSYSDAHLVGIIKEGSGTYRITGNDNYMSGCLRVMGGKALVMNDRAEAEAKKLRGAVGAKADTKDAIALVFEKGALGGTGSIAGTVDCYGTLEPGDGGVGTLTIRDYAAASKKPNLCVRPASVIDIEIGGEGACDVVDVAGAVRYANMRQDFSISDDMPKVKLTVLKGADVKPGDVYEILRAGSKDEEKGAWTFDLVRPEKYTWQLVEREDENGYVLCAKVVSLEDQQGGGSGEEKPEEGEHMGAFYDDGVDDRLDKTSMRSYAEKDDMLIGTAISTWKNDITNAALDVTQEVGREFNLLVAENEMKFDALQPSRGEFSFWAADNLVNYAVNHGMELRGHCLAWHSQVPQWVSVDGKKNDKGWTRKEALEIMKTHIYNVMQHFKGKVDEWDVVNECLADDQTVVRSDPEAYALREESVWKKAIGDDYIDSAFVYAHRANPDAKLFLNDYDVEMQGKAKALAFYNLVMKLRKKDIPIDGVGLQCHFSVGEVDSVMLDKTVKMFGEAGLRCVITELDMGVPSTSAADLEEQARCYRMITDIALKNDNCRCMVVWGMKDNDSWRSASNPLLYRADLSKKPAYYAVRSALRHQYLLKQKETGIGGVEADGWHGAHGNGGYGAVSVSGVRTDGSTTAGGIVIKDGKKYLQAK